LGNPKLAENTDDTEGRSRRLFQMKKIVLTLLVLVFLSLTGTALAFGNDEYGPPYHLYYYAQRYYAPPYYVPYYPALAPVPYLEYYSINLTILVLITFPIAIGKI
jgi:hypothetical protein